MVKVGQVWKWGSDAGNPVIITSENKDDVEYRYVSLNDHQHLTGIRPRGGFKQRFILYQDII
jgi:hypothetical protein